MRGRVVSAAFLLLFLLPACKQSADSVLIGTWDTHDWHPSSQKHITFRPDHTCTIWRSRQGRIATEESNWHIEKDGLFTGRPGKETIVTILKIKQNEIEINIPEDILVTWTRIQ